jgi:hypothetical protein
MVFAYASLYPDNRNWTTGLVTELKEVWAVLAAAFFFAFLVSICTLLSICLNRLWSRSLSGEISICCIRTEDAMKR